MVRVDGGGLIGGGLGLVVNGAVGIWFSGETGGTTPTTSATLAVAGHELFQR